MEKITIQKAITEKMDVIVSASTRINGSLETFQSWEDYSVLAIADLNAKNSCGNWDEIKEEETEIFTLGNLGDFGESEEEAFDNLKKDIEYFHCDRTTIGDAVKLSDGEWEYCIALQPEKK